MRPSFILALGCALAACTKSGGANDLAMPDFPGATLACPALASYCDHALQWAPCAPTLSDASAAFCVPDGGVRPGGPHVVRSADCGALRVLYATGVDTGYEFYYDASSGALVAVVGMSGNFGGSSQCVGGPATFTLPSCQPAAAFCG